MAQHVYIISDQSGAAFRSDLNNALAAIVSQNSGASAPSTTYAYQFWADTTTGLLKIRNAANSAWIALRELDGTLTIEDGTAAAPGLAFESDLNTGLYRVGADQLGFATGGSGRLLLDASGNLVIGDVSDTNTYIGHPAADTLAITTGGSERCRVDSSGRLLVGTSSSYSVGPAGAAAFQVEQSGLTAISVFGNGNNTAGGYLTLGKSRGGAVGSNASVNNSDELGGIYFAGADGTSRSPSGALISAYVDGTPGTNDMPGRLVFSTTADGASSPTERLRITQAGILNLNGQRSGFATPMSGSGNVRVAAASGGGIAINTFDIQDYTAVQFVREVAGTAQQVGTITCSSSATAYNTSSDYRLKENVVALDGAVTRLKQIPVHRFNFIAEPDKTVDGFLAHEVQEVVPEAITGEKDEVDADGTPVYQGIDQSKLVPLLTAALQEAIGEIESLKARVAVLEAQ